MNAPCPFCGSMHTTKASATSGHGESSSFVRCYNCWAQGPDEDFGKFNWNSRASGLLAENARLRAALKELVDVGERACDLGWQGEVINTCVLDALQSALSRAKEVVK